MSESQRARLLPVVEEVYARLTGGWEGQFMLSELLGDKYCDARAFAAAIRLYRVCEEVRQQFVPQILEHVGQEAASQETREQALAAERTIFETASGAVRNEAASAYANLDPEWAAKQARKARRRKRRGR